jgi:putative aldouronate transport system permease protein
MRRGRGLATAGEKSFQVLNYALLGALCLVFFIPLWSVICKSVSGEASVLAGEVKLWPLDLQVNAYRFVLHQRMFFTSLGNSAIVVAFGTCFAMAVTVLAAYPLTKKGLRGRNVVLKLMVITMVFSAGTIPGYLLVKNLGLLDTRAALILPAAISPFHVIILRTFMQGIPISLEESAKMDGAGYFTILAWIIIPLSVASISSLSLFQAVGLWNDFFRPLLFIRSQSRYTLQLYLRGVVQQLTDIQATLDPEAYANVAPQSVRNATIILSTLPILLVYPFLQRYFVTGVRLGAVKE